ncbi:MAG: hydrogenase maturation protease [Tabrizicola sp.]
MPLGARVLLIGYGNPARGDDGLGPALAEAIADLHLPGVTVEIDYQLTVDHAALIAAHDLVIFADAAMDLDVPFRLTRTGTTPPSTLGSHQVTPEVALHLAGLLFGKIPPAFTLAIAGTAFDAIREGLGPEARCHLGQAVAAVLELLGDSADDRPQVRAKGL